MLSKVSRWLAVVGCLGIGGWLPAWAGSGTIGTDGNIDILVNVRFPISSGQMSDMKVEFTKASQLLWDATEGQMRLRNIRITCTSVNEDLADYWVFSGPLRSSSCFDCLARRGGHVNQEISNGGRVYAHEFGHLGLGLGDEYEEDSDKCRGRGPCISEDPPQHSDVDQCLMQEIWDRDDSELCVRANHDPLQGNNPTCKVNPPDADGAPCKESCAVWNVGTQRIETTVQSMVNRGESCWETMARKFPFLRAPAGRPQAAPPAGFVAPVHLDLCRAADTISLLLDRSTSMELSVAGKDKEVCGNKFDDDKDGKVDEKDDCSESRMEFVKAAARAFVDLGFLSPFRVDLVSFDSSAREHIGFVDVAAGGARLKAAVDAMTPGGLTAIGEGLSLSRSLLAGQRGASKAVLLITDGENSTGPDPRTEVPAYRADGIRIYSLATGDAVDSRTLRDITTATRGDLLDARDPSSLVTNVAQQWASYNNLGVLVPQRPYALSRTSEGEVPPRATVRFTVEPGMQRFAAVLAGDLHDMSGFGVRALLQAPGGAVLDSTVPAAGFTVVADRFFTLLVLDRPEPGTWQMEISGLPSAAPLQTGRLIVLADNPLADLFADVDKTVVDAPTDTVELTLMPYYLTGLADVDWDVRLQRPDGSVAPVAVVQGDTPYVYRATVTGFVWPGNYGLEITLRTRPTTTNDPGETRPGTAPPNTLPVPLFERHLRIPLLRPSQDRIPDADRRP